MAVTARPPVPWRVARCVRAAGRQRVIEVSVREPVCPPRSGDGGGGM